MCSFASPLYSSIDHSIACSGKLAKKALATSLQRSDRIVKRRERCAADELRLDRIRAPLQAQHHSGRFLIRDLKFRNHDPLPFDGEKAAELGRLLVNG